MIMIFFFSTGVYLHSPCALEIFQFSNVMEFFQVSKATICSISAIVNVISPNAGQLKPFKHQQHFIILTCWRFWLLGLVNIPLVVVGAHSTVLTELMSKYYFYIGWIFAHVIWFLVALLVNTHDIPKIDC